MSRKRQEDPYRVKPHMILRRSTSSGGRFLRVGSVPLVTTELLDESSNTLLDESGNSLLDESR